VLQGENCDLSASLADLQVKVFMVIHSYREVGFSTCECGLTERLLVTAEEQRQRVTASRQIQGEFIENPVDIIMSRQEHGI
jgi:hypothetical protein